MGAEQSPYFNAAGDRVARCTEIIGAEYTFETKDFLLCWAAWRALERYDKLYDLHVIKDGPPTDKQKRGVMAKASNYWRYILDSSAAVGTAGHGMIEEALRAHLEGRSVRMPRNVPNAAFAKACVMAQNWLQWTQSPLVGGPPIPAMLDANTPGIEVQLISERLQVGGTCDFMGYLPARPHDFILADWKSSKSVDKDGYRVQLGGYAAMVEEIYGFYPVGALAVRCSAEHAGQFASVYLTEQELRGWSAEFVDLTRRYKRRTFLLDLAANTANPYAPNGKQD